MREVNSDSSGLMGRISEVRMWRKRKERAKGIRSDGAKRKGKRKGKRWTAEYRIGLSVESIQPRGGSLNCLCLFRKQRSAAVHQNGRLPSAGSRCLIHREILFLSLFLSSLDRDPSTRCWFTAFSSWKLFWPIDGKDKRKEVSAIKSNGIQRETTVLTNVIARD